MKANWESETITRGHELAWWQRLAATVSPNPRVLLSMASGCVAELVLRVQLTTGTAMLSVEVLKRIKQHKAA